MTPEEFRKMVAEANKNAGRKNADGSVRKTKKDGSCRKTPEHKEENLQGRCVAWFRMQYPGVRIRVDLAGIWLPGKVAWRLKRLGVIERGFADIEIYAPSWDGRKHLLLIEVKDGKNYDQSEAQKEFEQYCKDIGSYDYHVARSLDDFMDIVKEYFGDAYGNETEGLMRSRG